MSDNPVKVWLIAGETSGDMYGARLAAELRRLAADNAREVAISGMGGIKMREAGVEILVDSTELDVMGIFAVLRSLGKFIKLLRYLTRLAEKERPDTVVLIDYPGFNMSLARWLHRKGIKVVWYISPQVWAWKKYRIKQLARDCRKMLVIFPFEVGVYTETTELDTEFVGHPLLEMVANRRDPAIIRDPNLVVLLPGSRKSEVNRLLYPMLHTAKLLGQKHPNLTFKVAASRKKIFELCNGIYAKFKRRHPDAPDIDIVLGETHYLQQKAGTGLAASGTVTVESAVTGLPLVVVYRLSWITIILAAMVIRLYRGFFTMVNVILNKPAFEEFLQWQVTPRNLSAAVERILPGGERREAVEQDMAELVKVLSPESHSGGNALASAAASIYSTATEGNK